MVILSVEGPVLVLIIFEVDLDPGYERSFRLFSPNKGIAKRVTGPSSLGGRPRDRIEIIDRGKLFRVQVIGIFVEFDEVGTRGIDTRGHLGKTTLVGLELVLRRTKSSYRR